MAGDFTGDGRTDLAVANFESNDVSILLGNGDGTFEPAVQYAVGAGPVAIVAGDFTGDGHSTWPSPTSDPTMSRCCWATATARLSPRYSTRPGRCQTPSWRATSPATAALDLAVANYVL